MCFGHSVYIYIVIAWMYRCKMNTGRTTHQYAVRSIWFSTMLVICYRNFLIARGKKIRRRNNMYCCAAQKIFILGQYIHITFICTKHVFTGHHALSTLSFFCLGAQCPVELYAPSCLPLKKLSINKLASSILFFPFLFSLSYSPFPRTSYLPLLSSGLRSWLFPVIDRPSPTVPLLLYCSLFPNWFHWLTMLMLSST